MRRVAIGWVTFALITAGSASAQELESAYKNLKDAEAKKDVDLVRKYAGETSRAARAVMATAEPTKADEKEAWATRVDYAKQVDTYTEYAMYSFVLQPIDGAKIVDLCEALEAQNPKSQYLQQIAGRCLSGFSQSAGAKLVPFAERAALRDPANEEVLLVLADSYQSAKEFDKALAAATKLVEIMSTKAKPDSIDPDTWQKRKDFMLGSGYWIVGVIQGDRNRYAEADKALRAALPVIKEGPRRAPMLFYLGVANYQLGKAAKNRAQMTEGAKFSEEAAALPGPFQGPALKNAKSIRAELAQTPKKK